MTIDFAEGFEPSDLKGRRKFSPTVEAAIEQNIQEQLALGIIEECDDPPVQEIVMIRKPDAPSGYHFCLDSRGPNKGIIVSRFDTMIIGDILNEMARSKYFASST